MVRSSRSMIVAAVVVVALAGAAAPALAQQGQQGQRGQGFRMGGGDEGRQFMRRVMDGGFAQAPTLSERDLSAGLSTLALSEDQRAAVAELARAFQEQVRSQEQTLRDEQREAMRAMREEQDDSLMTALREKREKARGERSRQEATLLDDVKSLLTPEQAAGWEGAAKSINRSRSLRRGFLSNERVSLREVVMDIAGDEAVSGTLAPEVVAILDQHDVELDRALAARDALLASSAGVGEAFRTGDRDAAIKMIEERGEASKAVGEVNKRFASQVKAALSPEQQARFDEAMEKATFPDVYRRGRAQSALDAAIELNDLSDEQRERLTTLVETFDAKYVSLRTKTIAARKELEENASVRDFLPMPGRGGRQEGGDRAQGLRGVMDERRTLDEDLRKELRAILTPEQADLVLEVEGEGRDGGGRRRGRDGAGETRDML